MFFTKPVEREDRSDRDVPSLGLCTRRMPVLGSAVVLEQEVQILSARDRRRIRRAGPVLAVELPLAWLSYIEKLYLKSSKILFPVNTVKSIRRTEHIV